MLADTDHRAGGGVAGPERNGTTTPLLLMTLGTGILAPKLAQNLTERPRPGLLPHGSVVNTAILPNGHALMATLVYPGVHWPTEVLAIWAAGTGWPSVVGPGHKRRSTNAACPKDQTA